MVAIDQLVEAQGIQANEPGVAVLIHQPGKLLFQKGYGLATLQPERPITPHTRFELASVTKTFTATAVLLLHDRGKLSIEDDVRKHPPELPQYEQEQTICIRDLLQHTSGLPDYLQFEDVPARDKLFWVNADYLELFAKRRKQYPLAFPTGQKYVYNNTNYTNLEVGTHPFGNAQRQVQQVRLGLDALF